MLGYLHCIEHLGPVQSVVYEADSFSQIQDCNGTICPFPPWHVLDLSLRAICVKFAARWSCCDQFDMIAIDELAAVEDFLFRLVTAH
jgi:hypothetical protein